MLKKIVGLFLLSLVLFNSLLLAKEGNSKSVKTLGKIKADWNNDGIKDEAALQVNADNKTSLVIFLSKESGRMLRAFKFDDIAWHDDMGGRKASIKLNKLKSIVIVSGNESVGRGRWHSQLVIVYRHGQFLVAGYTMDAWDTLNPKFSTSCDINFLVGKIIKNKKLLRIKNVAPTVAVWLKQREKIAVPVLCR